MTSVTAGGDAGSKTSDAAAKPKAEPPNLPDTLSLKTVSNIDKIKDVSSRCTYVIHEHDLPRGSYVSNCSLFVPVCEAARRKEDEAVYV